MPEASGAANEQTSPLGQGLCKVQAGRGGLGIRWADWGVLERRPRHLNSISLLTGTMDVLLF